MIPLAAPALLALGLSEILRDRTECIVPRALVRLLLVEEHLEAGALEELARAAHLRGEPILGHVVAQGR